MKPKRKGLMSKRRQAKMLSIYYIYDALESYCLRI